MNSANFNVISVELAELLRTRHWIHQDLAISTFKTNKSDLENEFRVAKRVDELLLASGETTANAIRNSVNANVGREDSFVRLLSRRLLYALPVMDSKLAMLVWQTLSYEPSMVDDLSLIVEHVAVTDVVGSFALQLHHIVLDKLLLRLSDELQCMWDGEIARLSKLEYELNPQSILVKAHVEMLPQMTPEDAWTQWKLTTLRPSSAFDLQCFLEWVLLNNSEQLVEIVLKTLAHDVLFAQHPFLIGKLCNQFHVMAEAYFTWLLPTLQLVKNVSEGKVAKLVKKMAGWIQWCHSLEPFDLDMLQETVNWRWLLLLHHSPQLYEAVSFALDSVSP
jgi:hypothetical protein